MIMNLLTRAAKPTIHVEAYAPNLGVMASWQNALWGNWPGYESFPWQYATEDEALDLAVVGGFLDIMVSLINQMPLNGYRDPQGGTPEPLIPNPPVLDNPSPGGNRTFGDFVQEYVKDMLLHGNYVAVLGAPGRLGWPDVIYPVPWGQWSVITTPYIAYEIGGIRYSADDVFHCRRNSATGSIMGRGLMEMYPRLLANAVAAEVYAGRYFEGGAVPPAQITHPDPDLTQENAESLKAKWKLAVQARQAIVTPFGTDVKTFSGNAEEAQLAETRKANAQALAIAVGIPGALLGLDAPSLTYRNITDVFQQFITTTVMGYLSPLEQQFTLQTLPRGNKARFTTGNVLRPDLASRVTIAVQGLGGNVFNRDEARALVDLPPDPASDPEASSPAVDETDIPPSLAIVGGSQ